MLKRLSFLFCCFFIWAYCLPQGAALKTKKTKSANRPSQNTPAKETNNTTAQYVSSVATKPSLDVLFATNDDCELYINEELKGTVFKSDFKYVKLPPGIYTYKAKNKVTNDELLASFTVKEGGTNEVFMDMLYLEDEKNRQRESIKKNESRRSEPVVQNKKKIPIFKPVEKKPERNIPGEMKIINSLVANMAFISGGTFTMGNNRAPATDEVEHTVTISPVFFSKYEVTQEQWEGIMGYNPSIDKDCGTCPVENVSWEEAMKFIQRLNVISDKKFRLPTEAEWEYIARRGGKAEIDGAGGQEAYIKKTAWYFENADKKTHPVGLKQSNVSGIYDLFGNVSEWCADWYGAYYYKEDFNEKNPQGPPLGKEKVIRGGNFKDYTGDRFRPSFRNKRIPTDKAGEVGFRLVMEENGPAQ